MILDLASGVLTDGDCVANLTPHQAAVVAAIISVYPNTATRGYIIGQVWPNERTPRQRSLSSTLYSASCKILEAGIPTPWTAHGYGIKANRPVDVIGSPRVSVDRDALDMAVAFLMTHQDIAARLVVLSLGA